MSKFFTEKLSKLKPYVPGEQPRERKYIKLNTNESPFPPSEKAISYGKEQTELLNLYSDPDCTNLVNALAKEYNVKDENIICTNGSDEVLNLAFMAYCDDKTPAYFPDITYGFYKVFASVNNVPYYEIPLKSDFTVDINDYIGKCGTMFIANPNAPTGIYLDTEKIENLLKKNKNNIVVIDEAYIDFGGESAVKLIDKYDNLLVTRTFSKSRSMAGARLGYGIANKSIIADLNRIRYSLNPYNVNRMTMFAGVGALSDKDYFENNIIKIKKAREFTTNELVKRGFTLTDSKANFIFAESDKISGEDLYNKLKEKGILVRHFSSERINNYVRITIGSQNEMEMFIKAVDEILKEIK